MPSYEPRDGQAAMADRVARVLEQGGVLLAEAGTGTGKTLAYLVPAILSRQRVLISTGTKNLQEQIYFKDIPALREALDVPFTATYMKGRANYLCLHRLDQLNENGGPAMHDVFLPIIREWSGRTDTGDRAELEDLPEDLPFWNEVSATAETCLGSECPRYDDCFVTRMRQRAAASDVVIVNHHLLCADAAVRQNAFGEVIPACANAVVDEAHQLEDIATQYFGFSISTYRLEDYARDVERFAGAAALDSAQQTEVERTIVKLRDHARSFFSELAFAHRTTDRVRGEERVRVTDATIAGTRAAAAYLAGALDLLEATLALLAKPRAEADADPPPGQDAASLARRAGEIRDELRFLLRAGDPAYVYFVEFRGKGIFLRAAPIDVSAIIRELLFDRMRATVLTSATLTVDGRFDYIRDRLGISGADDVQLTSEFDFTRQAILYLPPRMPDPRSPEFAMAAGHQVIELLKRTRGRAFVLFTSCDAAIGAGHCGDGTGLSDPGAGDLAPLTAPQAVPRNTAQRPVRHVEFLAGVDVVGEALSCVIIDKLPFASPSDPITAARVDAIRARGGEPFSEYQVPLAILALQQGLGRLIRHRQDRGVMAVLDPRLRTKGYGRRFLASLPPAPVVHDLAAVEGFFSIV
jgi:ATP-dependent DNA helicase DinG